MHILSKQLISEQKSEYYGRKNSIALLTYFMKMHYGTNFKVQQIFTS